RARALRDEPAQLGGLRLQLRVRERLEVLLVAMNRVHDGADALHLALEAGADDLREPALVHQSSISGTAPAPRCSRARRRARGSESTGPAARAPGSSSRRRPAPALPPSGGSRDVVAAARRGARTRPRPRAA